MMYASPALTKQNVATVLVVNDGCCSGPFHSDQSCFLNKLCSFPTTQLYRHGNNYSMSRMSTTGSIVGNTQMTNKGSTT